MNTIDTLEQERTNLDLHVDLCAQRYGELDRRLSLLDIKMDDVKTRIDENRSTIVKAFIATAGSIFVALCGLAGVILTTYPIH
jgi:hypothetical protein